MVQQLQSRPFEIRERGVHTEFPFVVIVVDLRIMFRSLDLEGTGRPSLTRRIIF